MDSVLGVLGLWVLFAASHVAITSGPVRTRLVDAMGLGRYLSLFSVVALAIFVPLAGYYFGHRHEGPLLWAVPITEPVGWLLYAGNTIAFVLMAGGFLTPSPVIPGAPYSRPRGAHCITRHGVFMGLGLWGLMHLVPNGFTTDVVFFGGFVLLALAGCWHQDRRKLASGDARFREFYEQTPFIPFSGPRTLQGLKEFSPLAAGLGSGSRC